MMSWGKRPSDPKAGAGNSLRMTPTRASESEFSLLLEPSPPTSPSEPAHCHASYLRKSVSFQGRDQLRGLRSHAPYATSCSSPVSPVSPLAVSPSTNTDNGCFFSYHEPFREHDYASYAGGMLCFTTNIILVTCVTRFVQLYNLQRNFSFHLFVPNIYSVSFTLQ